MTVPPPLLLLLPPMRPLLRPLLRCSGLTVHVCAAEIIIFCNPNNPTGACATREQLQSLVNFALESTSFVNRRDMNAHSMLRTAHGVGSPASRLFTAARTHLMVVDDAAAAAAAAVAQTSRLLSTTQPTRRLFRTRTSRRRSLNAKAQSRCVNFSTCLGCCMGI